MKKIFLTLALTAVIASTSLFAAVTKGPGAEELQESLDKEFPGAQNVQWSEEGGYQKATFVLAGHRAVAYFDQQLQFAGCARDIFYDQLPMMVMKAVDKKYPSALFSQVREISNEDGTSYLLVVEKNSRKYNVKVSSEGSIASAEKIK